MLTRKYCKEYIKNSLGSPYVPFELTDEQLDFWLDYTITQFSSYIPNTVYVQINNNHRVEKNVFLIPYDGNIISVLNVYSTLGHYAMMGHPYIPIQNQNISNIYSWENQGELYSMAKSQSSANFTFQFKPPKYLVITPSYENINVAVELAVEHSPDLSTIKTEYIEIFLKMYYINIGQVLVNIRSTYRTISTPFGDIELNVDNIQQTIDRYRDEIKEYTDSIPPFVYIARG